MTTNTTPCHCGGRGYLTHQKSNRSCPRTIAASRPFQCMECGKKMTLRQAEKAMYGVNGCPKCGGADIDEATL